MCKRKRLLGWGGVLLAVVLATGACLAQTPRADSSRAAAAAATRTRIAHRVTLEQRLTAAADQANAVGTSGGVTAQAVGTPVYFGNTGNYANSPPLRKFVDLLPGLGPTGANNLGQYLPIAVPDTTTYPGSDYYIIELRQYVEQMHSDLPRTKLRGYVQVTNKGIAVSPIHYLGPLIIAQKDRPVRIKFTNKLPTGSGGNLFLPVDTSIMGAGTGPLGMSEMYTQNRATLHLHGGLTPWISDGTPHQWITPKGETTSYPKGVSVRNVSDMPDPGDGSMTFYYSNQQSARLMFYHDHAFGITRLNVYAGEAAGYLLQDPTEAALVSGNIVPADQIPLIIQDKTFVPMATVTNQTDPTWDRTNWGGFGSLWFPHVYMPNQDPNRPDGINARGRWDYGPWFWPPWPVNNPPIQNSPGHYIPNVPDVSTTPEAFQDTPVVNGTAYPICRVGRKAYRFRILNACNDRFLNLGLYYARSNKPDTVDPTTGLPTLQTLSGEISMVPANPALVVPSYWPPPDGRASGFPNPNRVGPPIIQIGTEGGFLPAPVVIPSTPIGYDRDPRSITIGNVKEHGLFLGPAERADVIIDFSAVPTASRLILYSDSPAPVPASDARLDYYTGNPDLTAVGGAPSTVAGYGPNTRTIMQFEVAGPASPAFDLTALQTAFASAPGAPGVFASSQDPIIVPQEGYNSAYNATYPAGTRAYARIADTSLTFTPRGSNTLLTIPFGAKALHELFENDYGRMNSVLGLEMKFTNGGNQTTLPFGYIDPATELISDSITPLSPVAGDGTQIWKITHNGVDTHSIHFHLFNVQIVNRVDWAGVIKPPDPNELGWKETVRMNPLEDCIVALRPVAPKLPFGIPDSIRPLNPAMPLDSATGFAPLGPDGNSVFTTNIVANFGWEYVWHCHLLGHEELDMMRPVIFNVNRQTPFAPTASGVRAGPYKINLTWTDPTPADTSLGNPANEVGFRIERGVLGSGVFTHLAFIPANATSYADNTVIMANHYRYRVIAYNPAGQAISNIVIVP